MIGIAFFETDGLITGFDFQGHSGYAMAGNDIICAAVSSAVELVSNTITEVLNADADVQVFKDAHITLKLKNDIDRCQDILQGLKLHMKILSEEYRGFIRLQ